MGDSPLKEGVAYTQSTRIPQETGMQTIRTQQPRHRTEVACGHSTLALTLAVLFTGLAHAAVLNGEIEEKAGSSITLRGEKYSFTPNSENRGTVAAADLSVGDRLTIATAGSTDITWYRATGSAVNQSETWAAIDSRKEQIASGRLLRREHSPQLGRWGRTPLYNQLFVDIGTLNGSDNGAAGEHSAELTKSMVFGNDEQRKAICLGLDLLWLVMHKDVSWIDTYNLQGGLEVLKSMPPGLRLSNNHTAATLRDIINTEIRRRAVSNPVQLIEAKQDEEVVVVAFSVKNRGDDKRLLTTEHVRVVEEDNGTVYWAPASTKETGVVCYKINLPGPLVGFADWKLGVIAYNHFSDRQLDDDAQVDLEISADGNLWVSVQNNFGVIRPEDDRKAHYEELAGATELYMRARLRSVKKIAGRSAAQFLTEYVVPPSLKLVYKKAR